MTKFMTGAALIAVSLASLSTAFAEPGPGGPHGKDRPAMFRFEDFDTDGNGSITAEEIATRRAERAAALDANNDGKISAEELAQAEVARMTDRANEHARRMVERMDTDGDGLLSAAELATPPEGPPPGMFDRLDADGDGAITQDEMEAARQAMHDRHDGPRPPKRD